MAKNNNSTLILVLLVAVGIGAYFLFSGGATDTPETPLTPASICAIEDVSLSPNMVRLGKAGTSLATSANNYFIITDALGSQSAAASTTVSTNKDLEILFGENSSAYYSVLDTINTGCSDPLSFKVDLPMADTTLSEFYFTNSNGAPNDASTQQGMDANDEFEPTVTIKAGTNEYFGNPTSTCKNVAVVQYDKTYFQKATGAEYAPIPRAHTFQNATFDGRDAFYIPKTGNGELATFNIRFESTSTAPDGTSVNPIITIYDCDIDLDADTLKPVYGVEDEDGNSISLASQSLTAYIN